MRCYHLFTSDPVIAVSSLKQVEENITQEKVVVLTDMALGEEEIDEEETEKAMERAKEQLHSQEHDLDAEEVAHLQAMISKQMAALHFKRKYKR